ncbi:MAG: manganese efflux pump MntP family protein [Clostridia bacterium]|nr:manganese efflux pump MntP family protein [Clostridia bacterium]
MELNFAFFLNSVLLGVGLAMDAFSVSAANGLADPKMKTRRALLIAGTFAFFQFLMPVIGWVLVHYLVELFRSLSVFIPWIALGLLSFLGGKMLIEGIRSVRGEGGEEDGSEQTKALTFGLLLVQGVATSIDALSVGLTIESYNFTAALIASVIIAAVTLAICLAGVKLGKTFGNRLEGKASILGGAILIGIGIEIFISGVFF